MGLFDAMKRGSGETQAKGKGPDSPGIDSSEVLLSTGDLHEDYDIIDVVIATDSHQAGVFSGPNPAKAFDGVKTRLRERGAELGADAIVSCQFEYRVAVAVGTLLTKQCLELFAYGTAVRLRKKP